MSKTIHTELLIQASAEKIWSILTDVKNYPQWNPFITSLTGEIKVNNRISIHITPPNRKGMSFKPKVLAFIKNKEFRWIGHLLFPGIFDGEHKFEIIDHANGTCTFVQSEVFKGILVGLLNLENTKKGFELMNTKLKVLAEQA